MIRRWLSPLKGAAATISFSRLMIVLALIILAVGVSPVARYFLSGWITDYTYGWISTNLGFDHYLALFATAMILVAVAFIGFATATAVLLQIPTKRALVVGAAVSAIAASSIYTVGRDICFDRITGHPLRYYAETPSGLKFSSRPGTEPSWGISYTAFTAADAARLKQTCNVLGASETRAVTSQPDSPQDRSHAPPPNRVALERIDQLEIFNPKTGEAQLWYARSGDGSFDLFDQGGIHPQTGMPLLPVDTAIVRVLRQRPPTSERDADREQARNPVQAHLGGNYRSGQRDVSGACHTGVPVAVVAVLDGRPEFAVSAEVAASLGGRTDCFTPTFITSGAFANALEGDFEPLQRLSGTRMAARIVLIGLRSTAEHVIPEGRNLEKVTVQALVRVYEMSGDRSSRTVSLSSVGLGFDVTAGYAQARAGAVEQIIRSLR